MEDAKTGTTTHEGKVKDPEKKIGTNPETARQEKAVSGGFATLLGWLGTAAGVTGDGRDPDKGADGNAGREKTPPSPRMPIFDMDDALMRLGGNEPLMLDLMAKFVEMYSDAVPEIVQLVAEGKETEALRSAHTLKSVAGNISAKALYAAARDLEMAMREGRTSGLEPLIAILNDELNTAINAARCILESKRPSSGRENEMGSDSPLGTIGTRCNSIPGVDGSELALLLNRLSNCIQDHDPVGSQEFLASLAAIFKGNGWRARMVSIGACLENYDFEGAMQSVEDLVREIRAVQNP